MASDAWKKAVWPGAGKSVNASPKGDGQNANGVQEFGEKELMERHQHGPDPVGEGKVIEYDDN